jgi:CTP-dependent riboflavin kinase
MGTVILRGHVAKGCNHFQLRMTKFRHVFKDKVGVDLVAGTINVKIDHPIKIKEDFRIAGEKIGEGEQDLVFEKCRINGLDAFRIRPQHRTTGTGGHGDDTLEISCAQQVPGIKEGAEVVVELFR